MESLAGDPDTAQGLFERGLLIRQKTLPRNHPDQFYSLFPFGEFLLTIGEFDRAEELFREALRISESSLVGPDHPESVSSHAHLALLAWSRGEYETAFAGFDRTVAMYRKIMPERLYFVAINLVYQASSAAFLGRSGVAIDLLREIHGMEKLTLEDLEFAGFASLRGDPEFDALVEEVRANPPQGS